MRFDSGVSGMSEPLTTEGRPWRLYFTLGGLVGLVLIGLFAAGREENTDETTEIVNQQPQQQKICQDRLAGHFAALDPTRLGITNDRNDLTHDLQLWLNDCGAQLSREPIAQDRELVERLLPTDAAARAALAELSPRDVAHLRTQLLLRQIAEHVAAGETSPLEQAVALFGYVQRSIAPYRKVLPVDADAPPPMTPYEALVRGCGTIEHRVWTFVELLRQIEIDAVILQPAGEDAGAAAQSWLVGVIVPGESAPAVYLFDPANSLPIPGATEDASASPLIKTPATLAEARADDSRFRQLDFGENSYPLTSAAISKLRVAIVGNSSLWSNRIAILELAGDHRGAKFYDGLGQNRLSETGQYDRIVAAGAASQSWTADDLIVWDFPELETTRYEEYEAKTDLTQTTLAKLLAGPTVDSDKVDVRQTLGEARHTQLTGAFLPGLQEYRKIREGWGYYEATPLNDLGFESAIYWSTQCQYDLGEFESVRNALVALYPPAFKTQTTAPIWAVDVVWLGALGSAELQDYPAAVELTQALPPLEVFGRAYLLRRWMRLGGLEPPAPAPATGPIPADDAVTTPPASNPTATSPDENTTEDATE
jgi:hypothetical protein